MQTLLANLNSLMDKLEQFTLFLLIPNYKRSPKRVPVRIISSERQALEVLLHKQTESKPLTRRLPLTSILKRRRC
jgi:hypothetical protein